MKKIIIICLSIFMLLGIFSSCSKKKEVPQLEQIKAICELSTIQCYYNNVAKSHIEKGEGITHLFEKDREYWIEYEGYADIGIDMSLVTMDISDNTVTVSIPHAEIMSIGRTDEKAVEVYTKDAVLNKNKITTELRVQAIEEAQKKMKESVELNNALFAQAEKEAKRLIENYIESIGELTGIDYTVKWKSIDQTK